MRVSAFVALVLVLGGCGCNGAGPSGTLPEADARAAVGEADAAAVTPIDAMPTAYVILGTPPVRVKVTLARTPAERERGLMYVQNLPMDDGMLFIFEDDANQFFWMKNTLIPLDMIFIRRNRSIAGIVENAVPLSEEPRGVNAISRYVLEVNGGWSAAHGVTKDSTVQFEGFTP